MLAAVFGSVLGGEIDAILSPSTVPAIVVSRYTVLSPHHVAVHLIGFGTNVFGNLTLTKNGAPYVPDGSPPWVRYNDLDGVVHEEAAHNFKFASTFRDGRYLDHEYSTVWRQLPDAAVHKLVAAKVGDIVSIASRTRGTNVPARVTFADINGCTITTDYPAIYGDSGALVTMGGKTVGLISSKIADPGAPSTGCVVIVPEPFMIQPVFINPPEIPVAGDTPRTNLPPVVVENPPIDIPVLTPEEAYRNGFRDGRARAIADIEALVVRLKLKP